MKNLFSVTGDGVGLAEFAERFVKFEKLLCLERTEQLFLNLF